MLFCTPYASSVNRSRSERIIVQDIPQRAQFFWSRFFIRISNRENIYRRNMYRDLQKFLELTYLFGPPEIVGREERRSETERCCGEHDICRCDYSVLYPSPVRLPVRGAHYKKHRRFLKKIGGVLSFRRGAPCIFKRGHLLFNSLVSKNEYSHRRATHRRRSVACRIYQRCEDRLRHCSR